MLQACLNGARPPGDHPAIPATPRQLADDVTAVLAVGIDAVHVHVKGEDGADTLDAGALASVLTALHAAAPGLPVGVTTGAWALQDTGGRVAAVTSWGGLPVLPAFASVNWHEEGAEQVAGALLQVGVGVEAGSWHPAGAGAWLASRHRDLCARVLLELPDGLDPGATEAWAERLLRLVGQAAPVASGQLPVLLHGEGTSTWPALRTARRLGLSTRIGLEDVLELPDGSPAADNAELVRVARGILDPAASS